MTKPDLATLEPYFVNYIKLVPTDNLVHALIDQHENFCTFLKFIPTAKEDYAYQVGKWTVKEVLQHIIDTERIFAYRALCLSRHDATPQPPFNENVYVANSYATQRTIQEIIHEYDVVRQATISLYKSFVAAQYNYVGTVGERQATPLVLGFALVGHCAHHYNTLSSLYL